MRVLNALMLSAALALPFSAPAFAEALVTVTGEATVEATPDMATISLGVTTEGQTAAEAMTANSKALQAVVERLKAAGIEDRDLQTSNLSLNPNWVGYDSGSTPKIAGYVASNMLNVRVRALDGLGSVLDASIADGANTLNGISFELAEPRPALDEARKAAVADARARAALLIEAAGGTLGKIVSITENSGYGSPMPMFKSDAAAALVPVAAGQIGLSASVTISFEIAE
ncbi:MAG: hypothetical protein FD162_2887 [Rhodobacteraceae bacterium]|uniref:SIMPL domain-containing protein n=1 Tax=Cypionkella sp. TaxID=2811411 RepID=UPI001326488B|nr:SIMPL domain-containing protein [Cypionkella sp.]KAF0171563.1 MAG: hypothetical protein FD162_2887 [Paracoccaceae bacterium]MDO8326235.1 SIMPL domain-containing protein [Cypionkella sp.]